MLFRMNLYKGRRGLLLYLYLLYGYFFDLQTTHCPLTERYSQATIQAEIYINLI